MALNKGLGQEMNLTGQLTLDLMHTANGDLVPIECNPRIHSAICTLEENPYVGKALTDPNFVPTTDDMVATSNPETMKYWIMD